MIVENSRSVAHRALPPLPAAEEDSSAILLFYQYKEPVWTAKEHKNALKTVISLAEKHNITGRGRVAPEGTNCTLTGSSAGIRAFCYELRDMDPLFNNTDFKITDGVPQNKLFKSLSVRKTQELVAYGLSGEHAPSLEKFAGTHLDADAYHAAMEDENSVIIDVRNAYESEIGAFRPPEGGAKLINPKMRNSIEFPKWLNDPKTQAQLTGKKVLMYCTGGIRCERASALLNQMSAVTPSLKPEAVYELRGGIERYVKTFPEGGYWAGKNYLFDRRMEQVPGTASQEEVESSISSKCCLCRNKHTSYRGQHKCSRSLCGVPVIVCNACQDRAESHPHTLTCELCKQGYKAPEKLPDLSGMKRKAEAVLASHSSSERNIEEKGESGKTQAISDYLFLSRVPLTATSTKLVNSLDAALQSGSGDDQGDLAKRVLKRKRTSSFDSDTDIEDGNRGGSGASAIKQILWLTDKATGGFYGSVLVSVATAELAQVIAATAAIKIDGKKIRVNFAQRKEGVTFPPEGCVSGEYPPVGK